MKQRTLGPFSGRQLTTMVVALIFAIGVPGTVWAVDQFTDVAIKDPVSGKRAMVDSNRFLQVEAKGLVTARASAPAHPWSVHEFNFGSNKPIVAAGPTYSAMNLTSLQVFPSGDTPKAAGVTVYGTTGDSFCEVEGPPSFTLLWGAQTPGIHERFLIPPEGLMVEWPTPLQYKPRGPHQGCIVVFIERGQAEVNATGFYGK